MMKRNLAKILVLVLIVTLLAPAMVSAAGVTYKEATLTLYGPDKDGKSQTVISTAYQVSDDTTLKTLLLTSFGDLPALAKETFTGTGMSDMFYSLYNAAKDNDGWAEKFENVTIEPEAAKAVLVDTDKTVADLIAAGGTSIVATLSVGGDMYYNLTLRFFENTEESGSGSGSAGGGGGAVIIPSEPSPSPSAEPAEEEPVVVDGSDITEEEPFVIEETVTVADSADEATEIVIENIPEDVETIDVEVALEAAEDAEVSENTTVLAVKDKDGNVTIIPMAIIEIDEDGNITAKGSLSEELVDALKDGGSLIAFDNEKEPFDDVAEALEKGEITEEEADAVAYWQARGVIEGQGEGKLGDIGEEVDRARFVTMLNRAFGSPKAEGEANYADLDNAKYGYAKDAATWAAEAGLMNGIGYDENGNVLFGTGSIEAWQMALIMYRALGNSDTSEGYTDSWTWAVKNGLVTGEKDSIPDMIELCTMMQRLAILLDGGKLQGDSDLETPALDAAE